MPASKSHGPGTGWHAFAAAALVVTSTSFNAVTADAIIPAMPLMAKEFGHGENIKLLVQMISVAPAISIIAGSLIAGTIRRRASFGAIMVPGIFIYVLAGLVGLLRIGPEALVASRIALGFASGLMGTICMSLAAELTARKSARFLGYANAMASTTAICSYIAGGWFAREFGWRYANAAYAWPLLLLPLILLYRAPAANQAEPETTGATSPGFPLKSLLPIYLVTLFGFFIVFASPVEGPFLLDHRGMKDPTMIGIAISSSALTSAMFGLNYGWISQRVSRATQFTLIYGFFLASTGIVAFATMPLLTAIGISLSGCASGMLSPLLVTTLISRVPRSRAAEATAGYICAVYISVFCAPLLFGAIRHYTPFGTFEGLALASAGALAMTAALGMRGKIAR